MVELVAIKRIILMVFVWVAWAVILPIMRKEEGQSIRELLNFNAILVRLFELFVIGMFCILLSYTCIDVYIAAGVFS